MHGWILCTESGGECAENRTKLARLRFVLQETVSSTLGADLLMHSVTLKLAPVLAPKLHKLCD